MQDYSTRTSRSLRRVRTSPTPRLPQAYYNKLEGVERLATEDRRGASGARPCHSPAPQYGMECVVYMVKVSYEQKPYRKMIINTYGGHHLRLALRDDPHGPRDAGQGPGLQGVPSAWPSSEAVEDAATHDNTKYRPGLGAQSRAHPPDHHRPWRSQKQLEMIGEKAHPPGGLRGRRLQLRRPGAALPAPEARRRPGKVHRGGTQGVPDLDARRIPLRLRRHGPADPRWSRCTPWATDFMPAPHPRGRAALPRRRAPSSANVVKRGDCANPVAYFQDRVLRGGQALHADRGIPGPRPETSHAIKGAHSRRPRPPVRTT